MMKFINRVLFGGTYKVTHWDSKGKSKVFWCDSWEDALGWTACALNCDRVSITNTAGYVLAERQVIGHGF